MLSFGRDGGAPLRSCKLECAGAHLLYDIALDGGWIFVGVAGMDSSAKPDLLFTIGDHAQGWQTVCKFVAALERSGVRELQPRPLRVGAPEVPNSWVIG